MDISKISVSRKQCFDECHQKYKYRYHLKFVPDEPEPFHFVFGKVIHKMAEKYIEHAGQTPFDEIVNKVLNQEIPIDKGKYAPKFFPGDYQIRLPIAIKSLKKLCERIEPIGFTEYEFNYDLDPPNKKFVTGFIDRLIIKNNKAFIIDYKTTKVGKWRKDSNTILTDLQLRTYARVVQRNMGIEPENIHAALYYFEGENLIGARFNETALVSAEQELLDAFNTIKNMDPDLVVGNVGYHCTRCDYAKVCPFYNNLKH